VISSSPGGGARLKSGGTVALTVSEGAQIVPPTVTPIHTPKPDPAGTNSPPAIKVKSYVGLTSDQAQSELTAAGFTVNQSFAYSESVATGIVISQNPDGSVPVSPKSRVAIVVSQGSSNVYIPNIYSLSGSYATIQLENLQLKVVVQKIGAGKHVTDVSPKVGTRVKRGSTVVITLG